MKRIKNTAKAGEIPRPQLWQRRWLHIQNNWAIDREVTKNTAEQVADAGKIEGVTLYGNVESTKDI